MKVIIIISGPTASGKNAVACKIAHKLKLKNKSANIINADSKQVYKDIEIITNQPSVVDKNNFTHSLYGFLNINSMYSVMDWLSDVKSTIDSNSSVFNIVVGGTGFYIDAMKYGISKIPNDRDIRKSIESDIKKHGISYIRDKIFQLDPLAKKFIYPGDSYRILRAMEVYMISGKSIFEHRGANNIIPFPGYRFYTIHISPKRELMYSVINERVESMFNKGCVNEVRLALKNLDIHKMEDLVLLLSCKHSFPAFSTIGFKEIANYILCDDKNLEKIKEYIAQKTRQYAKKQVTWFRSYYSKHENELIDFIDDASCINPAISKLLSFLKI